MGLCCRSELELMRIIAAGYRSKLSLQNLVTRHPNHLNLLVSKADSKVHLLTASRPRPLAETSPKRGTSSTGTVVAAKRIRNQKQFYHFDDHFCIVMQSTGSPPSAARRSSFDSWKRAPASPPHASRTVALGFRWSRTLQIKSERSESQHYIVTNLLRHSGCAE